MIFFKYLAHTYQGADHTGRRVLNMGGGGGPSSSTTYTSNIPDWLRPQTEALLGAGTQEYFNTQYNPETGGYDIVGTKPYTPYSADPRDYVAEFSPQQQQVFGEAAQLQTPGGFQTGQQMTGIAGTGALGTTQQALGFGAQGAGFGGQGAMYGGQAAGMGGLYERMATDPMSVQAYMSPYMQQVVEIQKQQAIEDAQRAQLGANLGAARQGTYGGARQTLAQAQREAGLNKQLSDIQAQGLQNAFQQAQQAQQFGVTTGLQGLQTGISGAQTGIQGAGMGLQGVQGAQAGYGMLGQMGAQAANIGAAQQQADLARLGFQGQMGDIQQQQQQRIIDQAIQDYALSQEMPMQRLAGFNALLRGYATPTSTVSQYSAAPSGLQQLSGLGMTAAGVGTIAGMGKKAGGAIKYAGGGITDVNAIQGFAEDLDIPQLQQSMKNETLPKYVGMPILENKVNEAERMKMAQTMMASADQGITSIADGIEAKADQLQGINAAPVRVAGGGMIAFRRGGSTEEDEIERILAEAQAGRGPNVQRVSTDPEARSKQIAAAEKYRKDLMSVGNDYTKLGGIAPEASPAPMAPTAPAMPIQGAPTEEKKDMAALLAAREAEQKAFLGEDPGIKKLREALEKQGEESFLDRLMRGSQMMFAGEAQRTKGDIEPAQKVLAGEAARKQAELKRQEGLAEVESADYRRKADIYKEVAGEERKKAETASERAFQEKVLERKLQVEKELARMKPASASEYIGQLLRSKDRKDREVGKMLLGQSKTGALTRKDAAEMVLKANPTLAYSGKEQELEDAINRIMSTLGSSGGFTPSAQQQSILNKYQ